MEAARDYVVMRCKECGKLNVIHENNKIYAGGNMIVVTEEKCACGGELETVGRAILRDKPLSRIEVNVDVERGQLDQLIEDIAIINQEVNNIFEKIQGIKETISDVRTGV